MSEPDLEPEPSLDEMHNSMVFTGAIRHRPFSDRDLWIAIRGSLIFVVKGIEAFSQGSSLAGIVRGALLEIIAAVEMRWNLKRYRPSKRK